MRIHSPAFTDGGNIPPWYTCDGENIPPQILIEDIPKNTKSLTLIVEDIDSIKGVWTHWILFNISSSTKEITYPLTSGIEGVTDFGTPEYGGPCPQKGEHRYYFILYALDTTLSLEKGATRKEVEESMKDHILERSVYIGHYERKEKVQ